MHRHKVMILKDILKAIQTKGCGITITEIVKSTRITNTMAKRIVFSLLEHDLIVDKKAKKVYEKGKGTIKNYYYITEKGNGVLLNLDNAFEIFKEMEETLCNEIAIEIKAI